MRVRPSAAIGASFSTSPRGNIRVVRVRVRVHVRVRVRVKVSGRVKSSGPATKCEGSVMGPNEP